MNTLGVARLASTAAATIIRDSHSGALNIRHKGVIDLVTQIDLAAEKAIRAVLAEHTPDIPVLAEEGGGAAAAGTRWIVDPLDGTTNFVHGSDFLFCVISFWTSLPSLYIVQNIQLILN